MTTPPCNNGAADAFATREPVDPHDGWTDRLERSKFGNVRATFANLCTIIEHDALTRGRLWRNEMDRGARLDRESITDVFLNTLRERYSRPEPYGAEFATHEINSAVDLVASRRTRHPVREWLDALRWDGTARLDGLCARVLGNAGAVQARMVRMWMLSAVARAFRPGCQVDTMLVLQGKQGAMKSTFFAELGGEWFTDAVQEFDARSLEVAHKYWICELAELDGVTRKSDVARLKADITRRVDDHHRKYAVRSEGAPRGFVFCGSVNSQEFLSDETGSRRFWIIATADAIDIDYLRAARAQLWAEAVAAYRAGEQWWFNRDEAEAVEDLSREFTLTDSREERVRAWLLSAAGDVTTRRVLVECLGYEDRGIDKKAETSVGLIMRRLGWERRRTRVGVERVYLWERRERCFVPTGGEGGAGGRDTIDRGFNAVVPTVPTVPTERERVSRVEASGSSGPLVHVSESLRAEVGTKFESSESRGENAANLVPTPSVAEVGPGTEPLTSNAPDDSTYTDAPANDGPSDASGESAPFDVAVYLEHRDGTRELYYDPRKGGR